MTPDSRQVDVLIGILAPERDCIDEERARALALVVGHRQLDPEQPGAHHAQQRRAVYRRETRGSIDMQLSEVIMRGVNGSRLALTASVDNSTQCNSPGREAASMAVDGSVETKWLCHAPRAALLLRLSQWAERRLPGRRPV